MDNISDVTCDTLRTTYEKDDRRIDALPLDDSRMLRRTTSCASIDTVRPLSRRSIRRCIAEIAESLQQRSAKKIKRSSKPDAPEKAAHDPASDSRVSTKRKSTSRGRKASPQEDLLDVADGLYSDVPSERDAPSPSRSCKFDPLINEPLRKEDLRTLEDFSFTNESRAQIPMENEDFPQIDIKDVQLGIHPFEPDMTIWDGLQDPHLLFKCRLFLRCTTQPYDSTRLPDVRRIEMDCHTHPVGSHYARPPVIQATYDGASLDRTTRSNDLPDVDFAAGIHIDKSWHTFLDDDDTWGWYRDAVVPLSPRLFDKIEYREFKLVSRVWMGESWMDDELTFGISMLLREVDMT